MYHPPVIVITSNNERDFSEAFTRRCVVMNLERHNDKSLREILQKHLGDLQQNSSLLEGVLKSKQPTDVILQAFYVASRKDATEDKVQFVLDLLSREHK